MYAVIKTGGKQYRVAANDQILIEKLDGEAGDQVQFTDVLLVANGDAIEVGAPLLSGVTVVGEIERQEKSATVYIFKKRRRKHYRRRNGHRQLLTSVTITDILTGGAKPVAKEKAAKPAKASSDEKSSAKGSSAKASSTKTSSAKTSSAKSSSATSTSDASSSAAKAASGKASDASSLASPGAAAGSGAASGKSDDISLIGGIGPKMQKTLADMGITTFAQIASWTDADIEKLEEAIKPKGRIQREEWVEQAKELMAGKAPRAKSDRERD